MSSSGAKPEFVDQDQVVAEQGVDDPADGVVGQAAVEGLDEVGGGEVADPVAGVDGGDPECDEHVGLAGARRARSGTRSRRHGSIPGWRGSRTWPAGIEEAAHVELVEGLGHREPGRPASGAGVGGVAGGDLGLDQGAQQLLGGPALGLGGDQQLGGELGASRPASAGVSPVVEVRGQRRVRGHDGHRVVPPIGAVGVQRPGRHARAGPARARRPAGRGVGCGRRRPGSSGRRRRATGRTRPPGPARRPRARLAVGGAQGADLGRARGPAGCCRPRRRRSGTPRRPGPSAQNCFSAAVRGSGRPAWRVGRGPP